jgi:acyl carrier protein
VLVIGDDSRFPAVAQWLATQRPRELLRLAASDDFDAARAKLAAPLRAVVFAPGDEDAHAAAAKAREIAALAAASGAITWLLGDANDVIAPQESPEAAKRAQLLADFACARRASGEAVTHLALACDASAGALHQLSRVADADAAACILHDRAPNAWDAASSPLLRELGAASVGTASKLVGASPEERRAKLREIVAAALAVVLRLGAEARARIDWNRPLSELGLDSLMGVELHTRIEEAAGLEIPPALLFAEPNLEAVVERIAVSIGGA